MYQALYRKYRPKTFDEVVGQDVIIQTLKNSIVNNKINHAYLLAGPRGCGKTTIAKIFAKLVNCENSDGKNTCGECVFCTQNNQQLMDIIEMDAASNNGVDEIREINNKVNLVPSTGKYKIYIIDEVHMLTIGAFNALLKTLEEPPSHAIFILATTDPQKVPITILSRCQRFDLKKISSEEITKRLEYICNEEKIDYEVDSLEEISRLGDGCLRDSISILDQVISYTDKKITLEDVHMVNGTLSQKQISDLMNNILDKNVENIINLITKYTNSGKNIIKITEEVINFLKNCILSKSNVTIENQELYENFKNNFDINKLLEYINIMNETMFEMKKFSDPKLLLELSFIKMVGNNIKSNNIKELKIEENNIEIAQEVVKEMKQPEQINKTIEEVQKEDVVNVQQEAILTQKEKPVIKAFSKEENENLKVFIETRINNTLAEFSKKITSELKNEISKLMDYILDEEFGNYVTMIMDGTLKAASDKNMIFVYKSDHISDSFNKNIIKIENLIDKVLEKEYKVISVSEEKWNIIKEEFNNKTKNYEYKEETLNIEEILNNINNETNDDVKNLFGELVEYK